MILEPNYLLSLSCYILPYPEHKLERKPRSMGMRKMGYLNTPSVSWWAIASSKSWEKRENEHGLHPWICWKSFVTGSCAPFGPVQQRCSGSCEGHRGVFSPSWSGWLEYVVWERASSVEVSRKQICLFWCRFLPAMCGPGQWISFDLSPNRSLEASHCASQLVMLESSSRVVYSSLNASEFGSGLEYRGSPEASRWASQVMSLESSSRLEYRSPGACNWASQSVGIESGSTLKYRSFCPWNELSSKATLKLSPISTLSPKEPELSESKILGS